MSKKVLFIFASKLACFIMKNNSKGILNLFSESTLVPIYLFRGPSIPIGEPVPELFFNDFLTKVER